MTLAVQVALVRELFSVLYGSDLAFGFTLASWTVLTALGALVADGSGRVPRGVERWGLCVYGVVGVAVFLAVRAWGAMEVIPFHSYLLIPLFLGPLCMLGGMLFPWLLGKAQGLAAARAYGLEVAGGLAAGIACAMEFYLGGRAGPFVLGVGLLGSAWAAGAVTAQCRRAALLLAGLATAVLPLSLPGQALERLSLRLRFRGALIEDAVSTPHASLVAVRGGAGQAAVYENGLPWPLPEYTTSRAAVVAVMQALPTGCERVALVHALRAGFGPVLSAASWREPPRLLETDPRAVAFARRHLGGRTPGSRPLPFGARALRAKSGGWDLVAVLSAGPGGLLANRPLTYEFATLVQAQLSPRGVFVIALPAAPGFTHPAQDAYIESVEQGLRLAFPAFCELRTQVGWTLLVGGRSPLDREAAVGRLRERLAGHAPAVAAEAHAILEGTGSVSLDALLGVVAAEGPVGREAWPNRVAAPRAYFRFLQFRGWLVEDAPAWWRWLFRERTAASCWGLLLILLAGGTLSRRGRSLQGVFWAAWTATLTLVLAIYLYQSLAGDAFWAAALLSAASLAGILGGTRCGRGRLADGVGAGLAWVPALLFPLHAPLQYAPAGLILALLLGLVAAAGACLGYVFARRSAVQGVVAQGGTLFAVDLLGAGAGLFLGGVLLPWWCGFAAPALAGSSITFAVLLGEAYRRVTA